MVKKIPHFINNQEFFSKTFFPKVSPVTEKIISEISRGSKEDAKKAIDVATETFPVWREIPILERADLIRKATFLMEQKKKDLAKCISEETGRSNKDALNEVSSACEYGFYWSGEGKRFFGRTTTSSNPSRVCYTVRSPIGVSLLITSYNGPLSGMVKKVFPSLLCGNTVVLKSHEYTPMIGIMLANILKEVGLPPGVLSVVQGLGIEVGAALAKDKRIDVISFTGSVNTGKYLLKAASDRIGKVCLELGGKNPIVVLEDANLERAVSIAVSSAFIEAGQRCAAASRVIIQEDVYDQFKELMIKKTEVLKVGSGDEDQVCPLISEKRLKEVMAFVDRAQRKGANILTGGKKLSKGFYMQPTILENVSPNAEISQKEVFGPVVCLYKVKDFNEAVILANNSNFGLTSAIHTSDLTKAMIFSNLMVAGVVRVNGPTHGSENHMPFGGVKFSGNGFREPGEEALNIYSEWKFISIDY